HRDEGPHQAINALKALVVTAPDELREQLRALSAVRLVQTTANLEPGPVTTPAAAARLGLGTLARRQVLSAELAMLDTELDESPLQRGLAWWCCLGSGRTRPGRCWSPPATTLIGCAPTPASQCCAGPHRSRPPRARPNGIG